MIGYWLFWICNGFFIRKQCENQKARLALLLNHFPVFKHSCSCFKIEVSNLSGVVAQREGKQLPNWCTCMHAYKQGHMYWRVTSGPIYTCAKSHAHPPHASGPVLTRAHAQTELKVLAWVGGSAHAHVRVPASHFCGLLVLKDPS